MDVAMAGGRPCSAWGFLGTGELRGKWALAVTACLALAGCTGFGPSTIERDQPNYSEALSEAAKRQVLLNIVRLRYADLPSVVSVSQIVAGYERRGTLSLGADVLRDDFSLSDDMDVGAEGSFTDRPTVTFSPLRGEDYADVMLRPMPPSELFSLILAGGATETAFGLVVQRINGIRNVRAEYWGFTPAQNEFREVVHLLTSLRDDARLDLRIAASEPYPAAYLTFLRSEELGGNDRIDRLIQLLRLDPTADRYRIVFGATQRDGREVAVLTRPLIQILSDIAATIDVPEGHVKSGRTFPTRRAAQGQPPLVRIGVEEQRLPPLDAFVSVRYNGYYFAIANDDFESKRVFSMLLLLMTIVERAAGTQLPLLTIPSG
jgi:hypothetical protein